MFDGADAGRWLPVQALGFRVQALGLRFGEKRGLSRSSCRDSTLMEPHIQRFPGTRGCFAGDFWTIRICGGPSDS